MRHAFSRFFGFITKFFTVAERGMNTVDIYAQWAEREAQMFLDTSTIENSARLEQIQAQLKLMAPPSTESA